MIFQEQHIVAVTGMVGQKMPLFIFKPFEVNDTYLYLQIFLMLSKWTSASGHILTSSYMVFLELK